MMFFDPDRFAVYAGFLGEVVELEGKPYTAYGQVRDVTIQPDDLPVRCVCFNIEELSHAVDGLKRSTRDPNRRHLIRRSNRDGSVPAPIFEAMGATSWNIPHRCRVYLYPEAQAIIDTFRAAYRRRKAFSIEKFAKEHEDMLLAIDAARAEATETI